MHARIKNIVVYSLMASILAGCVSILEATSTASQEIAIEDEMSEQEYLELLQRVAENDALEKELLQNVRESEERSSSESAVAEETSTPIAKDSVSQGTSAITPEASELKEQPSEPDRSIALRAYQEVVGSLNNSAYPEESQVVTSESIGDSYRNELYSVFALSVDAWDEYVGNNPNQIGVFFTNSLEDLSWADEMVKTYGGYGPEGGWANYILKSKYWSGPDCGPGDATPRAFYLCVSSNPSRSQLAAQRETIIHEYFHIVHMQVAKTWQLPMWITEGSATYFGTTLGVGKTIADRATTRATDWLTVNYGFGWNNVIKNISKEEFVQIFIELESLSTNTTRSKIEKYNAYITGGLAVEYLIGVHGYQEFMTFLSDIASGITWQESFSRHYGGREAFYDTMYTYLNEIY
jgi:hypothetical protein